MSFLRKKVSSMKQLTVRDNQAAVPPPSYKRAQAKQSPALLLFLLSPANPHDAPFAQPLLVWARQIYHIYPRVIRLDAAYWGLRLIAWIHSVLGAVAVVAYNPKNCKNRSYLPPTWTREELGKRSAIERFFGRVFLFFHL